MLQQGQQQQGEAPYRYDPEMLNKVTALASQLQNRHQETLTAQQMEAIGAEVGLEPAFVRQALGLLSEKRARIERTRTLWKEFWSRENRQKAAAFLFPLLWGLLTFSIPYTALNGAWPLTALPVAGVLGFLAGQKKVGFEVGAETLLILILATLVTSAAHPDIAGNHDLGWTIPVTVVLTPISGLFGLWGASIRARFFPQRSAPSSLQTMSRQELLDLFFTLQRQLVGQKQHRAFLSVDVVGSTEMKRDAPELEVEYSLWSIPPLGGGDSGALRGPGAERGGRRHDVPV
ncbi:MAG TPA: hypothetical protein VFB38_16295 [Chthonomonadaceae bacterium]|nr:hypothetical protein [Chthonomonadaceae bacterium]